MPWLEASGIFCQCLKIALRHTALHSTTSRYIALHSTTGSTGSTGSTYQHTAVPAEVQGLKSAQWMKNGALAAAAKACREIESVNTVAVWARTARNTVRGCYARYGYHWYHWYYQRRTTGKAGANQRMRLRCEQEDRHLACAHVKILYWICWRQGSPSHSKGLELKKS